MKLSRKNQESEKWHLLFISDSHFRNDKPLCYTEEVDFWCDVQLPVINEVKKLINTYQCKVIHSGDLFDKPKPTYKILSDCLDHLREWNNLSNDNFYCVPGNHDLPYHDHNLSNECAWGISEISSTLKCPPYIIDNNSLICFVPYGNDEWMDKILLLAKSEEYKRKILVTHQYVWKGKHLPFPGCTYPQAIDYIEEYNEFDLIVTGDNHQSFVIINEQCRMLINPGCMIRQNATEFDYIPCGYLFNTDTWEYKKVEFPFEKEHINTEYLERSKNTEERKTAFVASLQESKEIGLDFYRNIEILMQQQKINKEVKTLIQKTLED